jgi:hypothetical protein
MGARTRSAVAAALSVVAGLAGPVVAGSPGVVAGPERGSATRLVDPPTRTIDVARLPRGRDARIDHLQDGVIHTAGGRVVPIRTPVTRDQAQLLGHSPKGWLVAVRKGPVGRVVAVRPGRRPVEIRHTRIEWYDDVSIGWRASRDGSMLVATGYDRGGSNRTVYALDGKRMGSEYTGAFFNPLDAADGHVVTLREDAEGNYPAVDWVPRTSRTDLNAEVSYISLREDLMFAHTTGRLYGPSPISAPTAPPWEAPFQPLAISPDRATAIGLRVSRSGFDDPAILDVRRMDDGVLLDSIAFGQRITQDNWHVGRTHEQTARWESDRRFVFQLGTPRGSVLVRCRLGGACQRASDPGGDITVPYETYMW